MQFIFWKPVVSISQVVLKKFHYYGPFATDSTDWKSIQFWLNIIQNLSIFIAFSGLMKFYHAVYKELEWCRPFAKFLCIKGVVFMTFWQSMLLMILAETTDVGGGGESADKWSEKIQNFLICLEMLLFSISHYYCFPVEEWQPGYEANFRKAKFGETMALNDFFTDLKIVMTAQNTHKKNKRRKSKALTESTIPEEDGESETEPGSVRSIVTTSDEDDDSAKEALIRALTGSIRSGDGVDEDEQNVRSLEDAQRRLGEMLDDMLLSPRKSTINSLDSPRSSSSPGRLSLDDGKIDYEENTKTSIKKDTAQLITDEEACLSQNDLEDDKPQNETTGLLTGHSDDSISNNLKPSIFTTIAEQQTKLMFAEDNNEPNNFRPRSN